MRRMIACTICPFGELSGAVMVISERWMGRPAAACATFSIVVAMPSGVLVSAFALLYDSEAAPRATQIVAFTTFVAVITIPLVALAVGL